MVPTIKILAGPTACGKSAVALQLAERLGAGILSIDSMKLYRGLDIGTGKPTPDELARVSHFLIDTKHPHEAASVAEFLAEAERLIRAAGNPGSGVPFLIGEGGTALYLKALSEGLFESPPRDDAIRSRLEAEAEEKGSDVLHERLAGVDPQAAKKILPTDPRRIVRALEIFELTGKPIGEGQRPWGMPRTDIDVRIACLDLPRPELYARIDRRIRAMLNAGWLDECRKLLALDPPMSREARQALGYKTLFAHLRGEIALEPAYERICFDTHHFARRQIHWFKKLPKTTFVPIADNESIDSIAQRVASVLELNR